MKVQAVGATLFGCVLAVNITVLSQGGNATSLTPYGLMFEEINHSADGGLYAELIRNRAFQGSDIIPASLTAYTPVNSSVLSLENDSNPLSSALPRSLRVSVTEPGLTEAGFANSGFWGIDVRVQPYQGSFFVKGAYNGIFKASLQSTVTNETFGSVDIESQSVGDEWTKHEFTLIPTTPAPTTNNSLSITFNPLDADKPLHFNLISLFPPTYNNRTNGLRVELMEAIADLKPKFLRFPGGANLNGPFRGTQLKWNETIGPLENRPGRGTIWGYYETQGLGLIEYLQWCDDLGMEPLLVVWSGLDFIDGPLDPDELSFHVQDSLDQIEFITGPINSTFGALRASLGYPEPWKLNYIQIGNEDNLTGGLESYEEYRLQMFFDAIKAKYPELSIMSSASELTMNMSIPGVAGDEHRYTVPDKFVGEYFGFFDHITHPTIISEIACVAPNAMDGTPSDLADYATYPFWLGSVAETVFLIGAERNGDRIIGASYAPLLANLNSAQWTPTQIAYDADPSRTARSTSYHTYKLLAAHTMTEVLPHVTDAGFGPLYWVAGRSNETGSSIFKAAVYNSTGDIPVSVSFEGVADGTLAELTILTSTGANAQNILGGSEVVKTHISTLTAGSGGLYQFLLPNLSVAVLSTTRKS